MYLGKIVEIARAQDLYVSPRHPYAQALLSAVPIPDPKAKRHRIALKGDISTAATQAQGCRFYHRCPFREPSCATNEQVLTEVAPGHLVACQIKTDAHGENATAPGLFPHQDEPIQASPTT
jgi:oligopeptide transport system ATP-binding protein